MPDHGVVPILIDAFSLSETPCAPSPVELQSQITLEDHAACHLEILIYQQLSEETISGHMVFKRSKS